MKRLIAVFLCAMMLLPLISCAKDENPQNTKEAEETMQEETKTNENLTEEENTLPETSDLNKTEETGETEESLPPQTEGGSGTQSGGTQSGGTQSGGTQSGGTQGGGTQGGSSQGGGTQGGGTQGGGTQGGSSQGGGTQGGGTQGGGTQGGTTPSEPKPDPAHTGNSFNGSFYISDPSIKTLVSDPKSWYEELQSLPIANNSMTEKQLRELCINFFKIQLSFPWTPNMNVEYVQVHKNRFVSMPMGMTYSGMPYSSRESTAGQGNIYKILHYYDFETGVLNVSGMGDYQTVLTSHCGPAVCWALNRISNSIEFWTFTDYTVANGAILVGDYTIGADFDPTKTDASTKIIQQNGREKMLEALAKIQTADILWSSPAWHVGLAGMDAVVVRNPDGSINEDESYTTFCDQNSDGTCGWLPLTTQSNGKPLRELGGVDEKMTFRTILDAGYIPMTIPEFVGTDPVEQGKAWLSKADPTKPAITNANGLDPVTLLECFLHSNYVISDITVKITDSDGTVLWNHCPNAYTRNRTYKIQLWDVIKVEDIVPYADGKHKIEFQVRITNGELLTAFSATIPTF